MMKNDSRAPRHREEAVARYRREGLWGTRTLADELHQVALRTPDAEAVVSVEGRLTFAELDQRTDRIAFGLHAIGLRAGDPVLFQVQNRLEAILAWYGVLKAGLIPVCTLAPHRSHEIGQISARAGAVGHIVEAGTPSFDLVEFALDQARGHSTMKHVLAIGATSAVPRVETLGSDVSLADARRLVEEIQATIDPDDVGVFQLSGGTTGVPKLIPRFHAEYWYNAREYARALGWQEDARPAHLVPVIHNAGIVCGLHAAHSVGACIILGTADLPAMVPFLARERATDMIVGHGHYLAAPQALPALKGTLRRVILSGAKPPEALFHGIQDLGIQVGQLFGMAEGLCTVARFDAPELARLSTVGTPISPLDEMKILDPEGEIECADGVVGELCCRGPYTTPGYFDADEHNKKAFTSDGFYRTGDLAKIVAIEGVRYLSIEGRIKDLINRGGEKINAEEIELLLVRHPGILGAALVAMPDARLGERACAFVVPSDAPLSLAEVQHHLETQGVAKFKWPERLEWRSDLPRTKVNKIDKKALREEVAKLVQAARAES